jgi:hypothetical protein
MQSSYREVLRCLLEGIQWLQEPSAGIKRGRVIQAFRRRIHGLGWEPVRQLYDEVAEPLAQPSTRGAWYQDWRIVSISIDGGTFDVADGTVNATAFGRPASGRGEGGFPRILFASLRENGIHVLFGGRMAGYTRLLCPNQRETLRMS